MRIVRPHVGRASGAMRAVSISSPILKWTSVSEPSGSTTGLPPTSRQHHRRRRQSALDGTDQYLLPIQRTCLAEIKSIAEEAVAIAEENLASRHCGRGQNSSPASRRNPPTKGSAACCKPRPACRPARSPTLQNDDPVGEGHRLHLVVGDVDDRRADLLMQTLDLGANLTAQFGIEVR